MESKIIMEVTVKELYQLSLAISSVEGIEVKEFEILEQSTCNVPNSFKIELAANNEFVFFDLGIMFAKYLSESYGADYLTKRLTT